MIVAPLCNISDKCYSQAAATLLTSNALLGSYCSYCPQQCSVTSFNIRSSMWKAPASWLLNDIKKFVESTDIPLPADWSSDWRSHVESSYLSVDLIHESSIVENYTQVPTETAVGALSNVGGQTGLWIGVSFFVVDGTGGDALPIDSLSNSFDAKNFRDARRRRQQSLIGTASLVLSWTIKENPEHLREREGKSCQDDD